LEVLGFSKKQSERIVVQILSKTPEASAELIIKEALKNL
jgi:Holliday junction DNA helicase RuvA